MEKFISKLVENFDVHSQVDPLAERPQASSLLEEYQQVLAAEKDCMQVSDIQVFPPQRLMFSIVRYDSAAAFHLCSRAHAGGKLASTYLYLYTSHIYKHAPGVAGMHEAASWGMIARKERNGSLISVQ